MSHKQFQYLDIVRLRGTDHKFLVAQFTEPNLLTVLWFHPSAGFKTHTDTSDIFELVEPASSGSGVEYLEQLADSMYISSND